MEQLLSPEIIGSSVPSQCRDNILYTLTFLHNNKVWKNLYRHLHETSWTARGNAAAGFVDQETASVQDAP